MMGVTVSINGDLNDKTENVQSPANGCRKPDVFRLSSLDDIIRVLQKLDDARLESIPVHPDTDDKVSWHNSKQSPSEFYQRLFHGLKNFPLDIDREWN